MGSSMMKSPSCPSHISTAVQQEEVLPAVRMCLSHSLDEVDCGDGIVWNTMVSSGTGICLFTLEERGTLDP